MPLSEFSWGENGQVYQVYGTKRKHQWEDQAGGDFQNAQNNASSKRQCFQPSETGDAMNEMLEINHNSIPLEAAPQLISTMDMSTMSQPQLHQHLQHQPSQIQHLQHVPEQYVAQQQQANQMTDSTAHIPQPVESSQLPNTMVMDLCDETYSHVELDQETQSMYSSMDSDCVPNLQQYGLAFCGDMCVGGDRSPTSGRIRCYCKPSWEGVLEMRPYVSDYY